jgi:hypothetical protein
VLAPTIDAHQKKKYLPAQNSAPLSLCGRCSSLRPPPLYTSVRREYRLAVDAPPPAMHETMARRGEPTTNARARVRTAEERARAAAEFFEEDEEESEFNASSTPRPGLTQPTPPPPTPPLPAPPQLTRRRRRKQQRPPLAPAPALRLPPHLPERRRSQQVAASGDLTASATATAAAATGEEEEEAAVAAVTVTAAAAEATAAGSSNNPFWGPSCYVPPSPTAGDARAADLGSRLSSEDTAEARECMGMRWWGRYQSLEAPSLKHLLVLSPLN